ncbi:MAG: DUF3267 domain-containing protein [Bacilli bacterium]|nr:DUF3267 domain-containing protein [Bacilli bacterium]
MKTGSVHELPQGYTLAYEVDLMKDKKMLLWINLLAVLMIIPFVILYFIIINYTTKDLNFDNYSGIPSWKLLAFVAAMILYIVIHEAIHGIFFKKESNGKLKFTFNGIMASASIPDHYFYKKPYLVAGLAPAVIMSVVFIVPLFFLDQLDFLLLYMLFVIHLSGCIGDFYISFKLRKYPEDTLIQDYGMGMKFYSRGLQDVTK